MEIDIREADRETLQNLYQVDGSLWVDSRLVLFAQDGKIHCTVAPIAGYSKPYERDEIDVDAYLDNPERVIYFAYTDGKLAGQIILRKNWNLFAWVEDIAVDVQVLVFVVMIWRSYAFLPGH